MKILSNLSSLSFKTKIILGVSGFIIMSVGITTALLIPKNNEDINKTQVTKIEPKKENLQIYKKVIININDDLPTIDSFIKKKSNLTKNLKIDYGDLLDSSKVGIYEVIIIDQKNNKKYNSKLDIIDKIEPELKLKDLKIEEGKDINITDFIESCTDNSNEDCSYYYVNDKDEKIDNIDKSVGKRKIKIIAEDVNGNKTKTLETNLEVTEKKKEVQKQPTNNNTQTNNDPEKGCYKTPENNTTLAYRFPCGMPTKDAYNKMLAFRERGGELSKKVSQVNDGSGHAQQISAGYVLIGAKYNSQYAIGIAVNIDLIDPVDKVASYGYLKEDGTVNWLRFRLP